MGGFSFAASSPLQPVRLLEKMKMQILVNSQIKELVVIDENGVDWSENFVAACDRSEFEWTEIEIDGWTEGFWECSQEDFEWWEDVCEKQQQINDAMGTHEFKELDEDDKDEFYRLANNDLDDMVTLQINWLKEKGIIEG